MSWIALLLRFGYQIIFVLYYKTLFPAKSKWRLIVFLLALALMNKGNIAMELQGRNIFPLLVCVVMMSLGLRWGTAMNWLQAIYGAMVCSLSGYCARSLFACVGVLVRGRALIADKMYYGLESVGLLAGLALFLFLRQNIFTDKKIMMLLRNESQLKLVIGYALATVCELTVMRMGLYFPQHTVWYPAIVFTNNVLAFGMLLFAIYQSIRGAELLIANERNAMLERQYIRQVSHYKSYEKYTRSFRAFNHDYKAMMSTIKALMRSGELEKATTLIDAVYDEAQKRVKIHKQYSDDVVMDVMLQDLANLCEENEIRYCFRVVTPKYTKVSLLDMIRVFSNVTTNAVEACKKLPPAQRYIRITNSTQQQWLVLELANSCAGGLVVQDGAPLTTKDDPASHGLGLGIVNEIIEGLGGFVLYETSAQEKTFSIRLFIPQTQDTQTGGEA